VRKIASRVLDPAIRNLLRGPLDTFEALEVTVALVRAPGQALSLAELVERTAMSRDQVARGVEQIQQAKLANASGGLVRLVLTRPDEATYLALVDLHARDPSAIAVAMSELALEKLRGMTAHAFAEAIANRKKDDR
jgi:hypothetical protein